MVLTCAIALRLRLLSVLRTGLWCYGPAVGASGQRSVLLACSMNLVLDLVLDLLAFLTEILAASLGGSRMDSPDSARGQRRRRKAANRGRR